MKRTLLLPVFAVVFSVVHAQVNTSPAEGDDITFNGYTISLQKQGAAGFIYDIVRNGKVVLHQDKNPFTGSPAGLTNKEDAVRVAKWQIIHINPVTGQSQFGKQLLPAEVAKQLKIETH